VLLLIVMSFVLVELLVVRFFVVLAGPGQGFTGSNSTGEPFAGAVKPWKLAAVRADGRDRSPRGFENVADVQEGVAVEPNVHEGGLHAWEDAGDFSFVDAADEREFFSRSM